jgi:lipoate-protein ligase A
MNGMSKQGAIIAQSHQERTKSTMANITSFPRAKWRLLHTPPARGAWNMAVDEAILEAVQAGQQPPTLRLYAWEPACLSLGYAQPVGEVDETALEARCMWMS